MNVMYRGVTRGEATRSQLLQAIAPGEKLTREQLAQRAGLSYEQVRRQTKNLCVEGVLQSSLEAGQRRYWLR